MLLVGVSHWEMRTKRLRLQFRKGSRTKRCRLEGRSMHRMGEELFSRTARGAAISGFGRRASPPSPASAVELHQAMQVSEEEP